MRSIVIIAIACLLQFSTALSASPFWKPCEVPERWNGINYYSRQGFYNMLNRWYGTDQFTGQPVHQSVLQDLNLLSRHGVNFFHLYIWDTAWGFGVGFNSFDGVPGISENEDPRRSENRQMEALHEFLWLAEQRCMFVEIHFASVAAIQLLSQSRTVEDATEAARRYAEWVEIFIRELSSQHRNIIAWGGPYALGPVADVGVNNEWNVFFAEQYRILRTIARETAPAPGLGGMAINLIWQVTALPDGYHYAWDAAQSQRAAKVPLDMGLPEPDFYMLQLYNANTSDLLKALRVLTGPPTSKDAISIDPKKIVVVEFGTSTSLAPPPYGMRRAGSGDAWVPSMTLEGHRQWLENTLCAFTAAGITKMAHWTLHDPWNFWMEPPFNVRGDALAWMGYWGLLPLVPIDAQPKPSFWALSDFYRNGILACATPPEPIIALVANRTVTGMGKPVTLTWTAADVDYLEIDNGIGQVRNSIGNIIVHPMEPGMHTYTLTARNTDQNGVTNTQSASVTIRILSVKESLRIPLPSPGGSRKR